MEQENRGDEDRRQGERRKTDDPFPPGGVERREDDRRHRQRRKLDE